MKAAKELAGFKKRLAHARTLLLNGYISAAEYHANKARIEPEINLLSTRVVPVKEATPDYTRTFSEGFEYLRKLPKAFKDAALPEKRRFLGSIFPKK